MNLKPRAARTAVALLVLPAAFSVGTLAISGAASAAPAHHVKSGSVTVTATLSAPASVAPGQSFTVSGRGYDPTQQAWIHYSSPTANGIESAGPDADGLISADFMFGVSGTVTFSAVQGGVTLATATTIVG